MRKLDIESFYNEKQDNYQDPIHDLEIVVYEDDSWINNHRNTGNIPKDS